MSIVFLADPRPHLEVGEWKQRKCVLSLQKVIPRPTGGGRDDGQTDRGSKIRQRESKAKRKKKLQDPRCRGGNVRFLLLLSFSF